MTKPEAESGWRESRLYGLGNTHSAFTPSTQSLFSLPSGSGEVGVRVGFDLNTLGGLRLSMPWSSLQKTGENKGFGLVV